MWTFALIAVVAAVAVLLLIAAAKPDKFEVKRSRVIAAPADRIYPHLADLSAWPQWSPYEKKDPGMRRQFGAISAGKGAAYAWSGNKAMRGGSKFIFKVMSLLVDCDEMCGRDFEAGLASLAVLTEGQSHSSSWPDALAECASPCSRGRKLSPSTS